jgi:hypothetical protein
MGDTTRTCFLICKSIFSRKLIIPTLLIVPNILLWAGILAVNGVIIQRDFNFPLNNENFEGAYYPLWNDVTSQTNIERFPRLVMMSPFLALSMMGVEVAAITKIMIVSTFTLITCTSYLFIKSLLAYSLGVDKKRSYVKGAALAGAFILAYNPVSIQFIGGISILASVAMLPLLLYIVLRTGTKKYFPLLIALPLFFSLGHPFVFVLNVTITAIFFFSVYYRVLSMRHITSKLVASSVLSVLLLAWLIIPFVSAPTNSVDLGRNEQLERETFELVSDNNFYKIVLLERDRFLYAGTDPPDALGSAFHYLALSLAVGIAFSALVLFNNNNRIQKRIILYLSGGFVATTLFALGSTGALNEFYWIVISESAIGWILRSPLKFQLYQAFFISALFAVALVMIRNRIIAVKTTWLRPVVMPSMVAIVLVGSTVFGIYNANTSSFNPLQLPEQYYEINGILAAQPDASKVLYYPRYNEIATPWSQGHLIGPFDSKSSVRPTYELSTTYSYVKEILYDYPYTNNILRNPDFINFLSSVGIKYIVFHNDRGYTIDQKNLEYLLASDRLETLYDRNGWYLFEIEGETAQHVHAVHSVIETDDIFQASSLASESVAVIDQSWTQIDVGLPNDDLVDLKLTGNELDVQLENHMPYPTFALWRIDGVPRGWLLLNDAFRTERVFDETTNDYVLAISTDRPKSNAWSNLISSEIPIDSGGRYLFTLETKTENAHGTHAKIQGYDSSTNTWVDLTFITAQSENGLTSLSLKPDTAWTGFSKIVTISNENITSLRYVINAGTSADPSLGDAVSIFRQTGVYDIDTMNLPSQNTAVNYLKIDPSNYKVHIVNEGGPFVLSLSEAYEKGWVAHYEDNHEIRSFPINGMINGFYVDRTGSFTMDIQYKPQGFFWLGLAISIITAGIVITYFTILYRYEIKKHAHLLIEIIATVKGEKALKEMVLFNLSTKVIGATGNMASEISLKNLEDGGGQKAAESDVQTRRNFSAAPIRIDSMGSESTRKKIMLMIWSNPSHPIFFLAIAFLLLIPLTVIFGENLANTVGAYALDFLIIGMIAAVVFPRKERKH